MDPLILWLTGMGLFTAAVAVLWIATRKRR